MFFGFWSWVLVFIVVVAIFSADRLPELKEFFANTKEERPFGVFFNIGVNYNTTDLENNGYESS